MTAVKQPFNPSYGSNQVLAPAAASAFTTIPTGTKQLRIVNTGANIAYVRVYSSLQSPAPSASTADYPVIPNVPSVITRDSDHDRLAHISAAGTTLQVMTGEGF